MIVERIERSVRSTMDDNIDRTHTNYNNRHYYLYFEHRLLWRTLPITDITTVYIRVCRFVC